MKKMITLLFFGFVISFSGFADVGQNRHSGDTGTAAVDEHYLDSLSKKDSAPVRTDDKTKTGYDRIESKEKDQERQEEGREHRPSY